MITLTNNSIDLINYCLGKANIKKSNNSIKKIYNYFESKYSSNDVEYSIIECNNYNDLNNSYISNEIKKSIHKLKNCHSINSKINNNLVNIIIYHNEENIEKAIKIILKYIQFMYNLSNYDKNINIIYYLTENEKKIKDKRNIILNPNNVNTGSSSIDNIQIWRKEELLKTTIHELIHHMNLDYRNDTIDIINNYKNKYNISSNTINSFESYVDFWAILINIFLCSKILNNPYEFFIKVIYLEIYFITFQAQKVLYITRTNNKEIVDINKYTNILSYYIIKAELFQNINKTLSVMYYNIKIKNIKEYLEYLKSLKKINNNNNRFSHMNKNSYIYKTMRMSICSIDIFD